MDKIKTHIDWLTENKDYNGYIEGYKQNKLILGENARLGIQRHLDWLELAKKDDYPYYFDVAAGDRAIKFMENLRLTSGSWRGKKWKLEAFQQFYFHVVYGWKKKENGYRQITEIYWCTARKSAKSEMTAGEELYHLIGLGYGGPQIFNVATTREQANYVFKPAKTMAKFLIKDSAKAAAKLNPMQYSIVNTNLQEGGEITCLTADADTNDGGNCQYGSIDEFHAAENEEMKEVVTTGMGARDEPLLRVNTTAGFNKNGPDFSHRKYCERVLRGEIKNDNLWIMIYDLDEKDKIKDNWQRPECWYKANPLMPITPKLDWFKNKLNEAITKGGEIEVQIKTKNLNWYQDVKTTWISSQIYKKSANKRELEQLRGLKCVLGLDLASEHDTTALTVLFPKQPGLEKPYYFTIFFCPDSKFQDVRVDGVFYKDFLADGTMIKTDGDVIDKAYIHNYIKNLAEIVNIVLIGHDPYKSVDLITDLEKEGFECGKVSQSTGVLGSANSLWREQLFKNNVEHDGGLCMAWQMGNIEMLTDINGNQKIVKGKGKKINKVDGPVSVSIAYVAMMDYIRNNGELSVSDLGEL